MKRILLVSISLLVLAACESQQVREAVETPPESTALRHVAEGRYGEAAREYLALSRNSAGETAQDLMLKAIALLLAIGRTDEASDLLEELAGQTLAGDLAPRRNLLAADVALRRQAPGRALELLAAFPAARFGPESAARLHLLRAHALEDTGRFMDAVRARLALDAVAADDTRRAANHSALWETLVRTDRTERQRALPSAAGALAGWLRLAEVFDMHRSSPAGLERALSRWRGAFSDHPANAEIVPAMLGAVRTTVHRPARIALLLPFHGDFAEAAAAIRDGFLAAWYADAANAQRPAIAIQDTSFEAVGVVYTRAVEAGADFVVGPLRRGPVTALACGDPPLAVTLALNELVDTPDPAGEGQGRCGRDRTVPNLYHFTLMPEAEARQVAERAWFDGYARAIAFIRDGPWGSRVYRAFADEWERLGGTLLDEHTLTRDATDTGALAAGALGILDSRERARELTRVLGRRAEFEPRRRQDVDFVFMAAFPADARQLMPQLAFHHGADLPVYATSHAWSGAPDPTNDRDLDGLVFGDMPWLVAPAASDHRLREQIGTVFEEDDTALWRLYAFGADAYRLATGLRHIAGGEGASIEGHTGRLSLTANHRIARRLAWTRFAGGIPAPRAAGGTDSEPPQRSSVRQP